MSRLRFDLHVRTESEVGVSVLRVAVLGTFPVCQSVIVGNTCLVLGISKEISGPFRLVVFFFYFVVLFCLLMLY